MQYKKDELKAAIVDEAEKEFFDKGYQNASLRQIAKRAGTTIGNLYNYFESKEALFDELVQSEYNAFIDMIKNHSDSMIYTKTIDGDDFQSWREIIYDFIQQLMPIFSKRFIIMLDLSTGTKYENAKVEFTDFLHQHFLEHTKASKQAVGPEFAQLIAAQFLYGILYVIRVYDDKEIKCRMISDLILFNVIGVAGIPCTK